MEEEALFALVEKLDREHSLRREEWAYLIRYRTPEVSERLFAKARRWANFYYGKKIYVRGLIEVSSCCRNNCLYCGIRRGNRNAQRYRLSEEQILDCAQQGYELGFRTFVLQGGEDPGYSDEKVAETVAALREKYPDCAITLSLGERKKDVYALWYEAGANRYLLRHETADMKHYARLHPPELNPVYRQNCLWNLKEIGYQVGTGFMVGSPYQTPENLADDFLFIEKLQPHMVGIGPFIPHHDTPFAHKPAGTAELTIFLLALLRLQQPNVLLPATTALGTIDPKGREKGVLAGANVIMPNLSPMDVRKKYMLYDNKISTGDESAQNLTDLKKRMAAIGYEIVVDRGDWARPLEPKSAGRIWK
jgi:biotin synthase